MANNPTIKAEITAEDKGASATIASLGKSFESLGKQLDSVNKQLNSNTTATSDLTSRIGTLGNNAERSGLSFGKMAGAIGLGGVAAMAMHTAMTSLEDATKSAIGSASDFEQYRVNFETMLGSADAAKAMLQTLSDFAVKTPFTLPGIVDASKQLLAMGINANELLPDIKALGDIAAGVGTNKLPEISLAFAQVAAKGHLAGQEIIQFSNAGVPVIDEVAKSLGKTRAETIKLSESGQISFGQVRQALVAMTEPGGRFFDLMEKQSKTFGGTMSNVSDQFGRLSRQILGISEDGTIQAGGPFAHLKAGAVAFMDFITSNANKISYFFQSILSVGIYVFKGLKSVIEAIGPGFILGATAGAVFGVALFNVGKVLISVVSIMRTMTLSMGLLSVGLLVLSVLAGAVLSKAFDSLMSNVKGATKSSSGLADALKADVPSAANTTGQAVDKLGQQLADLDDQMKKSTRDYREQLAQMVKDSQDKVKSLQGQLDDETGSFKDAQDKETADHADKIKAIQDQIDKESQMGVLADQTKIANLQQEIAKENNTYDKQAAKEKADHDKKMAGLQTQLDQETGLLQKHADDVKSIQDVTLLDTIDSLKRSHDEQMAEYDKQKDRITQNAADTGSAAGTAQSNAFAAFDQQFKDLGTTMGNDMGKSMADAVKQALKDGFKSIGTGISNWWKDSWKGGMFAIKSLDGYFEVPAAKGNTNDNADVFAPYQFHGSTDVTHHATGGMVQAGIPSLVGEQGIEMFVPSVNGRIIPNNKMGNMNGSAPINITIQSQAFAGSQIEARKFALLLHGALQDAMTMKGMA